MVSVEKEHSMNFVECIEKGVEMRSVIASTVFAGILFVQNFALAACYDEGTDTVVCENPTGYSEWYVGKQYDSYKIIACYNAGGGNWVNFGLEDYNPGTFRYMKVYGYDSDMDENVSIVNTTQTLGTNCNFENFSVLAGVVEEVYINGYDGDDTISGSNLYDIIHGDRGDDWIAGNTGDDLIYGEGGMDTLYGNYGNDNIYGGDEGDYIYGGEGNDTLRGEVGDDIIYGDNGDDYIYGGDNDDYLYGIAGNDHIYGGGCDDYDRLSGGVGDDYLSSGTRTVCYEYCWGGDETSGDTCYCDWENDCEL